MDEISQRQRELLKAITDEYITSASPVGSEVLTEKYNLKVSPATVKNEMASLVRQGFLEMPHISSGRKPTNIGIRYYINELMNEEELPVLAEISMRQRIWDERYEPYKLYQNITQALSEATKYLSVVSTEEGFRTHSGGCNILDCPEFYDIEVAKSTFRLIDNMDLLNQMFSKSYGSTPVKILIGDEINYENMDSCAIIFSDFNVKGKRGAFAVIGPDRMPYSKVIPAVKFVKNILNELGLSY